MYIRSKFNLNLCIQLMKPYVAEGSCCQLLLGLLLKTNLLPKGGAQMHRLTSGVT